MAIKSGSELCVEILRAVGIDPDDACSLVLQCSVSEVATLDVTFLVRDDGGIADVVKRYELKPKDEG